MPPLTRQAFSSPLRRILCTRWLSGALVLLAIAAGVYGAFSPGVGTGYLFDDATSVVPLQHLREHPEQFWHYVFSDVSGPLGRPLSIATFAAEQVFLKAGPYESQLLSMGLHAINGFLVFLLARLVFACTGVARPMLMGVFAAMLWALAPQKASSVLYIAQRMTLLAGTFTLLALVSYGLARVATGARARAGFALLCIGALLAAPFAKENGLLALPLLAALELFILPGGPGRAGSRRERYLKPAAQGVLLLGVMAFLALGCYFLARSEVGFSHRSFGFTDRLFYSLLAVTDYARQFLLPDTRRMGLLHDDFSGELLSPAGLVAAVFVLSSLAFLAVSAVRRRRSVVAFALAVYFIGHSLESSFLPLELYFEHRNYLPSAGLALLAVAGLARVFSHLAPGAGRLVAPLLALYVGALTFSTFNYAHHWRSYDALLAHHLRGHPASARAHSQYGLRMAALGHHELAGPHIDRAVELSRSQVAAMALGFGDRVLRRVAAACLAGDPVEGALVPLPDGVMENPLHGMSARVLREIHEDRVCPEAAWDRVSEWIQALVASQAAGGEPLNWKVLKELAVLERRLGNPTRVYIYSSMASEAAPSDGTLVILRLEAATQAGDLETARAARDQLRALGEAGRLRPVEQLVLESLP
ncbi:MAG: hypothetical protein ACX93N_09500 [Pseudohaliea sp.]